MKMIACLTEKMIGYSNQSLHDIEHFMRVHSYASLIGKMERLDKKTQEILEISALVHDIACPLCREKYGSTAPEFQEKEGAVLVKEFLKNTGMAEGVIERVSYITGHHHSPEFSDGPDFQILLEADYIANALENRWSLEKIRKDSSLFKTEGGKSVLEKIFGLRTFFLETEKVSFSTWDESDYPLALLLWGNPKVTEYISKAGIFTEDDIRKRLALEISNMKEFGISYWPIFDKESGEFIGCCGLRPKSENAAELGFHLRPEFWGRGIAYDAASAVITYAFDKLDVSSIFAGHNPKNERSKALLLKLGFTYTGDEFYSPTGLYHPGYILNR